MTVAKQNNIKKGEKIIDSINEVVKSWSTYAGIAGVRTDLIKKVHTHLNVL